MEISVISNATIVNEGRVYKGSVVLEGERIFDIIEGDTSPCMFSQFNVIDGSGQLLLPGIIDTHVHFRDGGLHDNPAGDFASESRAALAGGVTSVVDMPNTNPQTTSLEALEKKEAMAAECSAVNYGFMLGATNDNIPALLAIEPTRYAAIKLFLGSSTGNMLVNDGEQMEKLFKESRKLIVAHCEDEATVQANMRAFMADCQGTDRENAELHPQVRNSAACFLATYRAVELARKYQTRLHIAHISTATELSLLSNFELSQKHITAEVTPNHLWFDSRDYARLGNLIKCNPAIKSADDRVALWAGLADGLIDTIATDHAPHPLAAKQKPYFQAPSGIPSIQHSLPMMLEFLFNPQAEADPGLIASWLPLIVQKMCHAPAQLFGIRERGYIRKGYYADLVLVRPGVEQEVRREDLLYKCGWSPIEGQVFHSRVERTFVNGAASAKALQFEK